MYDCRPFSPQEICNSEIKYPTNPFLSRLANNSCDKDKWKESLFIMMRDNLCRIVE